MVISSNPKLSKAGDANSKRRLVKSDAASSAITPKNSAEPVMNSPLGPAVELPTSIVVVPPLASSTVRMAPTSPMSVPTKPNAAIASLNWIVKVFVDPA